VAFARIEITGLREFQRALKEMDAGLPKLIRVALNEASGLVISYARPRIPKKSGKAAGSLKVRSSQRQARIAAGGTRAPWYPWLDYGGAVGIGGSVKREFRKEGRYIYPGLRENQDEITAAMEKALTELARTAGLEVT
jgi:hypothetical protein